jgi:hypothetical protein
VSLPAYSEAAQEEILTRCVTARKTGEPIDDESVGLVATDAGSNERRRACQRPSQSTDSIRCDLGQVRVTARQ